MDEKDFGAHLREHALMGEAHKDDHRQLAEELRETSRALALDVKETAARLAETLKTTADTHWRNHELKHQDDNRALDKAEVAVSKRLDTMNEFRAQLKDQAATFMTREQAASTHRSMEEKMSLIQKWIDGQVGKSVGAAPMWALATLIVSSVIVAVVVAFVTR